MDIFAKIWCLKVLQKPADWICSASDVDKKKGRKLDPNEDLRNKGFKAREIVEKPAEFAQNVSWYIILILLLYTLEV